MTEIEIAQRWAARVVTHLNGDYMPPVDISAVETPLRAAVVALYDAFDARRDGVEALQGVPLAFEEVRRVLLPGRSIEALSAASVAAGKAKEHTERAVADLSSRPAYGLSDNSSPLRGSGDVPRLHAIERKTLEPRLNLPAPPLPPPPPREARLPRPRTFEELRDTVSKMHEKNEARRAAAAQEASLLAEADDNVVTEDESPKVPDGFSADAMPALDEVGFIRAQTRSLFEEVAMVGIQRAPLLGDPWRTALLLEQRMLRAIDAIVAMGPVAVAEVESLALDAPVKDGSRLFAATMILGSVRGRDALASAERVLFDYILVDPSCWSACADALKLAPHDMLPLSLRTLLSDEDPHLRAIGIDVLAYRGLATPEDLEAAIKDAPIVAAAALPYAALATTPGAMTASANARAHDDKDLNRAGWLASALGDPSGTAMALRDQIDDPTHQRHRAHLLALVGDQNDAAKLLEAAKAAPSTALVDAVGWAGAVASIGPLIELVETASDDDIKLSAAFALERITGAGLYFDTEIEPEDVIVDEPPTPDVGEPPELRLKVLTSDPRDLPPEPETETVLLPTTNGAIWRRWYGEHAAEWPLTSRYRRGQPYSPQVVLAELDRGRCTPFERRALGHELVIRTGQVVRSDVHDFVRIQETTLGDWAPAAERGSSTAGNWTLPYRR